MGLDILRLGQLYSISEGKTYKNVHLNMPVPIIKRCCGSSHGWLAIVDRFTDFGGLILALVNPLKRALEPIKLPSLAYFHKDGASSEDYVSKVILSADPAIYPNTYVVMALYGFGYDKRCAFIKSGQVHWTLIEPIGWFVDVIFYEAQAYLLKKNGQILSFDVNVTTCDVNGHATPDPQGLWPADAGALSYSPSIYLVESIKGDLMHIGIDIEQVPSGFFKTSFKVFKVVLDQKDGETVVQQVEVKSMGDEAVFVRNNNSVSVLASKFPGRQPNFIYYTDVIKWWAGGDENPAKHHVGIFNIEDGKIKPYYSLDGGSWIVPSFFSWET